MTPTHKLVTVPVEPDAEIIEAMFDAFKAVPRRGAGGQSIEADWAHKYAPMVAAYRAMIAASPPEPTTALTPGERERVVAVLQRAKPFMAAAAAGSALVGDWEASGANVLGELVSLLADLTKEGAR